jgi:hypothetical protein
MRNERAGGKLRGRQVWSWIPYTMVHVGRDGVGQAALSAAFVDSRFDVSACVDPRPEATSIARAAGFGGPVLRDVEGPVPAGGLAIVCTASTARALSPLACELSDRGYSVVSSCEELITPAPAHEKDWPRIRATAARSGTTVIRGGVNPAFVMDLLAALASLAVCDIQQVKLLRRLMSLSDAPSSRRRSVPEEIGPNSPSRWTRARS